MSEVIHILDSKTIDKIAAGEVVEKPASVVKELVENSIDAGASKVTVEIKEGGISLIRVTDNGCGIDKNDLSRAFMRHATSKITGAEDLASIHSLGFRGEALSSISAVAQVELVTKQREQLVGTRVCCAGGVMEEPTEVGAPDGTTILVRNLFYNTPVRKKFLHSPVTEASYIAELMQHIALSHPEIAINYIQNGQNRFFTSGNGDLKEVIYRIYGKDVADNMLDIDYADAHMQVKGYIGKPVLARANRSYEVTFVNGRYIKNKTISTAVEEAYKTFLMQHKYPFMVLHFTLAGDAIDVNVHPTKMEIRILNPKPFADALYDLVRVRLHQPVLMPEYGDDEDKKAKTVEVKAPVVPADTAVAKDVRQDDGGDKRDYVTSISDDYHLASEVRNDALDTNVDSNQVENVEIYTPAVNREYDEADGKYKNAVSKLTQADLELNISDDAAIDNKNLLINDTTADQNILGENRNDQPHASQASGGIKERFSAPEPFEKTRQLAFTDLMAKEMADVTAADAAKPTITKSEQMALFQAESDINIVGQLFDTYWLFTREDTLYFVDQHAAHEKVNFERLMKRYHEKQNSTQYLMPPIVVTLREQELLTLREHMDVFTALGFDCEEFGSTEVALRGVPQDFYGCDEREMFLQILDELVEKNSKGDFDTIVTKVASMSCKAAIKGNQTISKKEMQHLLEELFTLENPYHCPHGRPTMFSMEKYELEKKFKRIV